MRKIFLFVAITLLVVGCGNSSSASSASVPTEQSGATIVEPSREGEREETPTADQPMEQTDTSTADILLDESEDEKTPQEEDAEKTEAEVEMAMEITDVDTMLKECTEDGVFYLDKCASLLGYDQLALDSGEQGAYYKYNIGGQDVFIYIARASYYLIFSSGDKCYNCQFPDDHNLTENLPKIALTYGPTTGEWFTDTIENLVFLMIEIRKTKPEDIDITALPQRYTSHKYAVDTYIDSPTYDEYGRIIVTALENRDHDLCYVHR
ncbi:hypothetical protein IJG78_01190 [Candidatus Saccharibacteria bacterium]|nr:hypothetical protein [Candidatus Saccharibacteria bacterium]